MYFVYVLLSLKDGDFYTGFTNNVDKRLKEHNEELSYYTKRYAPWDVETYIAFKSKEAAESFERYLKDGSGQSFLVKRLLPPLFEAK